MRKKRSRVEFDPKKSRLTPFRPSKSLLPRRQLTEEGRQAMEATLRDLAEGSRARRRGPMYSVAMHRDIAESLRAAARAATREGRDFTFAEMRRMLQPAPLTVKSTRDFPLPQPPGGFDPSQWLPPTPWPPSKDWVITQIDRIKQGRPVRIGCYPDLLDLEPAYRVCPGGSLTLSGFCFGTTPGQVMFEIVPGGLTVTMQIVTWTDTRIDCFLAPEITGLRPFAGKTWVVTASGSTSNSLPLQFEPVLALNIAFAGFSVRAGWDGYPPPISSDPLAGLNPFLNGRTLGDADFSIEFAEVHHTGEGHAEKTLPDAAGQSLAQGWHLGLSAGEIGGIDFLYRVRGPRGVPPPPVAGLGPWGFLGEIGC